MASTMGKLSRELEGLTINDIDRAYYHLDRAKRSVTYLKSSDIGAVPVVIGIVAEILIYVREEFWKDNAFKTPFFLNIPKWIGVITFFIKKIKEIVEAVKAVDDE